jgi:8-amino-7-oxononanoate synthase
MKAALADRLATAAEQRRQAGLERRRQVVEPIGPDRQVGVDGRVLIDFCSNDYLGLARTSLPESTGLIGAAASALVSGYHPAHRDLEAALADFTGCEAVCLFPSGYQANLAVGQALFERSRPTLADRLNHASLIDGLRLAGARLLRYAHADSDDARRRLSRDCQGIVTDAVFSMDGDLAPLAELSELAREKDLPLWVDDAHGFGILGPQGRGSLALLGLAPGQVDILVATFGKALGTAGAFVAGDRALIEHLENTARGLIYSTAPPPALARSARLRLAQLENEAWRREKLFENIALFRQLCETMGLALADSLTAIQILPVGDNIRALALADGLGQAGLLVRAIRPPTVPAGTARLRITLSSTHQPQDIELLCATLAHLHEIKTSEPA